MWQWQKTKTTTLSWAADSTAPQKTESVSEALQKRIKKINRFLRRAAISVEIALTQSLESYTYKKALEIKCSCPLI